MTKPTFGETLSGLSTWIAETLADGELTVEELQILRDSETLLKAASAELDAKNQEIEVLREYGNKLCTAMADDRLAELRAEGKAPSVYCSCPLHGSWIAAVDVRRLTREMDVALNGEAGAAAQASLCDVVAQVNKRAAMLKIPFDRIAVEINHVLASAAVAAGERTCFVVDRRDVELAMSRAINSRS